MWSKHSVPPRFKRLNPLKSRLEKYLSRGWERAVFRAPQGEDQATRAERVLEGPAQDLNANPDHFKGLWDEMHRAAGEGLVKQSIVVNATKRLDIDARHGSLRQKTRDEQSILKMMGNKERKLRPDKSQLLLRELGLLNADGSMSRRHARKYKQVHHFVEICQPIVASLATDKGSAKPLQILDLACGNSYLSFVLLEALHLDQISARLLGIDANAQFVDQSKDRANALSYLDAHFHCAKIQDAMALQDPAAQHPDLVVALHACDTATDQALAHALDKGAPAILCVPCCHAQVARQVGPKAISPGLGAILEHGLFKRAYGDLLTDVLRVAYLQAHGYEVSVLEFVAAEHSAKNSLIRAIRKGAPQPEAIARLREQTFDLGLDPALICTRPR